MLQTLQDAPAFTSRMAHSAGETLCMSPSGPMHREAATGFPLVFSTWTAHPASSTCSKYCQHINTAWRIKLLFRLSTFGHLKPDTKRNCHKNEKWRCVTKQNLSWFCRWPNIFLRVMVLQTEYFVKKTQKSILLLSVCNKYYATIWKLYHKHEIHPQT